MQKTVKVSICPKCNHKIEYIYTRHIKVVICPNCLTALRLQKPKPITVDAKPERNIQCPCGSGKKYKHCCGG